MGECAVAKAGPGRKSDTQIARRPAPKLVVETRLQRMQQALGNGAFGRVVQARLIVGPVGDPYEREADRVAEEVMGLHSGLEHTGELIAEPAEMGVHRLAQPNAPEGNHERIDDRELAHGGEPLPAPVRAFFEPRFGRDFSHVRVHMGALAEDYTEALNAYAFTYGHHIWMGRGQTAHPSLLLAHELTHVIQQTRSRRVPSHGHTVPKGIHEEAHGPLIRRLEPTDASGSDSLAGVSSSMRDTANAFNVGHSAIPAAPGIQQWRRLLVRDSADVKQIHDGVPRVQRQPKGQVTLGEPEINPPEPEQQPDKWVRLQVFASGMDHAAQLLAQAKTTFDPSPTSTNVFVGLHPKFVKVYDQDGKALGPRISLKEVKGLAFRPGVYIQTPVGMVALDVSSDDKRFSAEAGQSIVGQRPFTDEEKTAMAEEAKKAKKEGRQPKPAPPAVVNFMELLTEPERFRSMVFSVCNPKAIYFVPTYVDEAGRPKRFYASPIEGRGDGEPPNAPRWPVSMEGPKLVPVDSDPTYSARVDWTANGNFSIASQVIAQVGTTIHYRWELCDITQYAKKQAAENAAANKDDPAAKPEKTLDERIADFEKSAAGTGTDVTGMGGAKREFAREFEDWWKDTKRAAKGSVAPGGTTIRDRLSNAEANRLSLELAPVALLTTAVGAVVKLLADLFAGPRQQQEIPLQKAGIFLIRVITTPGINEDLQGNPVIRPPSVAAKVTEVAPMDIAVAESLDEPGAQLAKLQSEIDWAEEESKQGKKGSASKAAYLRSLLAEAKERFEGSPLKVLIKKRDEKKEELKQFRKDHPTLSDYSRAREVEMLEDQIALYERHERERTEKGTGLAPMKRLNATLISEVTGEQYPLLLSAGPMAMANGKYQWMVSDVTNREGDAFTDIGDTPSAALEAALTKFGGKAAYGRGRIGVRTAGLDLEAGAKPTIFVDSAPTDWALAEKRLDDLVTTLAVLGLFVASAGTASAIIGAGLAAARLIQRWQAGHLYLDAQTVSDALSLLGGLATATHAIGGLYVQKFEKAFAIAQEGKVAEAQLLRAADALKSAQQLSKIVETANEAIGYAGLLWGNISFLDEMISISQQEDSGAITHAGARRARAMAISSAVQNNGLFIAGNVLKAKGKAAKEKPTEPGAEKLPAPADKPAGEEILPEEGDKPAQKAGAPVPVGERQATQAELRAALPADLQGMLIVDDALHGDSVQAEYTLDKSSGLISEIRLHCSPDARPASVALHAETIRTMQRYQGFSGRVRKAISWLADLVGIDTLKPENKSSFEAALEVRKLPKALKEQMDAMQRMGPAAREAAQAQLDHLELQLEQHLRTLELGGPGEGAGLVAAKGLSKAKQKQYAELRAKLRALEPGTEPHKKIRREMYELIGGDLPYESWEKVYESNVDRANKANASVAAEHQRLGWGKPEQTIDLGRGEVRRLDIADKDPKVRKGIEVKAYESGKIYASEDIVWEVERDAKLVRRGWDITWVLLDTQPSAPLLEMLLKAGIPVEIRTRKGGAQSQLVTRHEPPKKPGAKPAH